MHILYGIFYRQELVIRHQLSQGLSPHLAVLPSACPPPAPSAAARGCQPRKADSQASRCSAALAGAPLLHITAQLQHSTDLFCLGPNQLHRVPLLLKAESLLVYGNFSFSPSSDCVLLCSLRNDTNFQGIPSSNKCQFLPPCSAFSLCVDYGSH